MSVYKFVDLVGTSPKSWEDAALNVVKEAGRSLNELRIAEVMQKDLEIERGKTIFRIKLRLSFKYLREEEAPAAKPAQKKAATPKKKADKKKPEAEKEKPRKAEKKKAPEKK